MNPKYIQVILLLVVSYLLGSIPFSWLIGKIKSIDLLDIGSRNPGTTNILRVMGWKWAIFALLLDALKGVIPVFFSKKLGLADPGYAFIASIAAILGHNYSIIFRFIKGRWMGGRGVATALGSILVLMHPLVSLSFFTVYILTLIFSRYLSLSILLASGWLIFIQLLLVLLGNDGWSSLAYVCAVAILLSIRLLGHINNLSIGSEGKLGEKFHQSDKEKKLDFSLTEAKIERVLSEIKLEPGYSLKRLIDKVQILVSKPIELIPRDMPKRYTGFCIVGDRYHILYEQRVSPLHQAQIILHELSHILLGHVPPHPEEEQEKLLADILKAQDKYEEIDVGILRFSYDRIEDQEAELLALRLLQDLNLEFIVENDPLDKLNLT